MIKTVVIYFCVFFISLVVSLVVLFPVNVLWERVLAPELNLKARGLDVRKVQGTIWQGKALISYQGLASIVAWDLDLAGLLRLKLPVHLKMNAHMGELQGLLELGISESFVLVRSAQLQLAPLNPILKAQRVTLAGELQIKDLLVQVEGDRITGAKGMASWSGGDIAYPAGREIHRRPMPAFKAILDTKNGLTSLGIRDSEATFDVISATLDQNGVAWLNVTRRLLDISNEPWSLNSREQDVVFKVKKELY